uniref:Si:ch211-117l17.7 n=1 Tax=Sinocyclocheilus grahami TaxID=75366 RepID=A0A672QDU0_SINGR
YQSFFIVHAAIYKMKTDQLYNEEDSYNDLSLYLFPSLRVCGSRLFYFNFCLSSPSVLIVPMGAFVTLGVFSEQSNLEQLQLDGNQIASISSELFEAMVNLTELNLSKNRLSQLDAHVFQSLTKLNYLNLADNQLRNLPKTLFHNLRQLKSLNQIREIPPCLFWHLPSLLTLSMSANQLRYIPSESFYYLPNLTKLTLYKNPLISLPYQLMGHMPRLQELYLYETNLSTLPWNLFANMTNLRALNLYFNNKLTSLPKSLFCCLPNLKKLSLKNNNLRELDPELFSKLISLKILMLNENKLESLPSAIFRNTLRLEILDLNHNYLMYLPGDVFVHARVLKDLSLSGNKWNCDCSIMGIAEWIRENPKLISDLDKGVTCYEPYRLENHPLQTLTYEELHCGVFQTTFIGTNAITTPVTPNPHYTFITATSLLSPTPDHIYLKQGNGNKNDLAFYDTIVLENEPEIVHNNHYNGWVYLWTVPSTGPYSGFMMALYIVLSVTGVVLIAASLYVLFQLHKMMWVLGKVTMGDNQRLMARRVRSFKVKL